MSLIYNVEGEVVSHIDEDLTYVHVTVDEHDKIDFDR